ncbi:MAG TPA: hypothetical protein H9861_00405 [Candidatus Ligilactobacillus excrementigallinarum]|uniref:Competence protein CoiA nuclease-like domain-containing protein n=1 Tax=Candidatus Ligilactobacillus excrementigallinarum TaxID=2838641 RepID=A0A9D1UVL5_9LACO|nr:hypothetical protein [Candidatus Ligilactobacillus excrementigallinarum]
MFFAMNTKKQLVHISEIQAGCQYYCPLCHAIVRVRKNNKQKAYFVHVSKRRHVTKGETQLHKLGKQLLAKWAAQLGYQVKLEYWIAAFKQRADVYLEQDNTQIILEYQCSPLSSTELIQRTKGYYEAGIKCLWIVGKRYLIKKRITQKQAQFFHYRSDWGFYYLYLNVEAQRLELYYQILSADFLRPIYRVKYFSSLAELIQFKRQNFQSQILPKISAQQRVKQIKRLNQICFQTKGRKFEIQKACYLHHQNFRELAFYYLSPTYHYPLYSEGFLFWKIRQLLKLPQLTSKFTMPFVNQHKFL